ncbi:MAG: hypothetical protein DLM70_10160 [Chloroflexi bacterium]|nr:MAG: hypothetical protein DLM70_10160 [Chloroflexota bacterium]
MVAQVDTVIVAADFMEGIMINLLWVLVAILIVAWLLGLGGVFHLVASLVWVILIVAIVLAVVAFLTGGYRS